ncbi:hypothetical protein THAOC_18959, partial [Thalassiosira oceanica]
MSPTASASSAGGGGSTKYGTESNNYNTSHFDEDTPRGELLTRVLERYTKERETVARVKRSRLLEFLDEARAEDPGRYGPVEMDPGWLSRRLGKEHKKRRPGRRAAQGPGAARRDVQEVLRRASRPAPRREGPAGLHRGDRRGRKGREPPRRPRLEGRLGQDHAQPE